jgi:hypothetical protein
VAMAQSMADLTRLASGSQGSTSKLGPTTKKAVKSTNVPAMPVAGATTPKPVPIFSLSTPAPVPYPTPQTPRNGMLSMRDLVGASPLDTTPTGVARPSRGVLSVDARIHKHCFDLPGRCEVSNSALQDPFLANDYARLPPLT